MATTTTQPVYVERSQGGHWIRGSRVSLDSVVHAYRAGAHADAHADTDTNANTDADADADADSDGNSETASGAGSAISGCRRRRGHVGVTDAY